jgi:hypothetical protein
MGERNFHPRSNSWSILTLGRVRLVKMEVNRNKYDLDNVMMTPNAGPNTPKDLSLRSGSEESLPRFSKEGIEESHPPEYKTVTNGEETDKFE